MLYGGAAGRVRCGHGRFAPRTENTFIVFTLLYAFITGLTYAGFTAFVMEALGLGAAATKFSLFASLSNMPIAYADDLGLDGFMHDKCAPLACSTPKPSWA